MTERGRHRHLTMLATIATLATFASSEASAQRTYYARERIAGVKPAAVQAPAPTPTWSCGTFATNTAPGDYTQRYTLGTTTSSATAIALCRTKANEVKTSGICTWNSSPSSYNAGWPPLEVNYVTGGRNYSGLWSGATAAALNSTDCVRN